MRRLSVFLGVCWPFGPSIDRYFHPYVVPPKTSHIVWQDRAEWGVASGATPQARGVCQRPLPWPSIPKRLPARQVLGRRQLFVRQSVACAPQEHIAVGLSWKGVALGLDIGASFDRSSIRLDSRLAVVPASVGTVIVEAGEKPAGWVVVLVVEIAG